MESLRKLQTQYAEKGRQLDELNVKIRQHIGKASPEELKAISNRQDSDRFAFDDQQKSLTLRSAPSRRCRELEADTGPPDMGCRHCSIHGDTYSWCFDEWDR